MHSRSAADRFRTEIIRRWGSCGIIGNDAPQAVDAERIIHTAYGFDAGQFDLFTESGSGSVADDGNTLSAGALASVYERSIDRETRRKKGQFYTPDDIISFMTGRALAYAGGMHGTMFDPAFGCGGFLIDMLARRVASCDIPSFSDSELTAQYRAVIDSAYGYEIDPGAFRIARSYLLLVLMPFAAEFTRRGMHAPEVHLRMQNADALSADPSSIKADLAVFNPPYLGEKGNKAVFDDVLNRYPHWRTHYRARMDYLYWFIALGIESLTEGGVLTAVTSTYWFTAASADRLRELVRTRSMLREIIIFEGRSGVFPQANVHAAVFTLVRTDDSSACDANRPRIVLLKDRTREAMLSAYRAHMNSTEFEDGSISIFTGPEQRTMTGSWVFTRKPARTERGTVTLGDICEIRQGIVPNPQRVTGRMASGGMLRGEPIFVFDEEQYREFSTTISRKERALLVPFHKNTDIGPKGIASPRYHLLYIDRTIDIGRYPAIRRHLMRYRKILSARRECRTGKIPWYSLHWPRTRSLFTTASIVCPYLSARPVFAYTDGIYAASDVYYITFRPGQKGDLRELAACLNSRPVIAWLHDHIARKGDMIMLTSSTLRSLPISSSLVPVLKR
ncbi:MAG: N-6 DNA methylase [Spirochaetota bacterium]